MKPHKLIVPPPPKEIILKGRALFFIDCMGSLGHTAEEEMQETLDSLKNIDGISFEEVELTEAPPFKGDKYFDYLFFDYGGMSIGNSMLEHFSRYFMQDAVDNPSKLFCVISQFTKDAVVDAERQLGKEKPQNVFYDIDEFIAHAKKFHEILT